EVDARAEAGALQDRSHHLVGRPRVRGALKYDELAPLEYGGDAFSRPDDVAQIRLLRAIEGRRDSDEDDVGIAEGTVVGRRREPARRDLSGERLGRDVLDVALPHPQLPHAFGS